MQVQAIELLIASRGPPLFDCIHFSAHDHTDNKVTNECLHILEQRTILERVGFFVPVRHLGENEYNCVDLVKREDDGRAKVARSGMSTGGKKA
jgi:hypothetical protein